MASLSGWMISPTEDRPQVPRRIEYIFKVSFFYYHHLSQLLSLKLLHGSNTARVLWMNDISQIPNQFIQRCGGAKPYGLNINRVHLHILLVGRLSGEGEVKAGLLYAESKQVMSLLIMAPSWDDLRHCFFLVSWHDLSFDFLQQSQSVCDLALKLWYADVGGWGYCII